MLNRNEIRTRAAIFAKEWANENSERAEAQSFWNDFFEVFGVKRRRVAVFEKQVAKLPNSGKTTNGRIDVFWPGTLLAEHKSAGRDLSAAFVRSMRAASTKAPTRKLAEVPKLFGEIRQPSTPYLLVPAHTSENRTYVPIGFMQPEIICGNANFAIPNATLYHFGILTSTMHMAWMRAVCGRLESRYRYSAGIVYNNFPWPLRPEGESKTVAAIESAAQAVLNARAAHPGSTLADLYDPIAIPDDLRSAHKALDKAVDTAYAADGGNKTWSDDAERVGFLFQRYAAMTGLLHDAPVNKVIA